MKPALEDIFPLYKDRLFATALHVCGNPDDACDIVQETFATYLTIGKEFQSEEHVRAWLFRVCINKAKNTALSFWNRNTGALEAYMEGLTFEEEEDRDLFWQVMALPGKYRTVIHLHYYEDYSVDEIAKILGITPGNVKVRLNRGRNKLRDLLGGEKS